MKTIFFSIIITSILLTACKKNEVKATATTAAEGGYIKFGHWVTRAATNNKPIQIKVNGQRVSYSFAYAESFPGGGANQGGSNTNDYLNVPVGKANIQLSYVNAGTTNDSVVIFTGIATVSQGRYYSMFFTDSNAVKSSIVDDKISENLLPTTATAKFKFFNGVVNEPYVDVYLGTTATTPIYTNVAYNTFTDYSNITPGSQTVVLRTAGTPALSTNILASQAVTIAGARLYTVAGRGYKGLVTPDIRRVLITTNTTR
jgi:hypothetical protein